MQPFSDDIKILCRCRQVRMDLMSLNMLLIVVVPAANVINVIWKIESHLRFHYWSSIKDINDKVRKDDSISKPYFKQFC